MIVEVASLMAQPLMLRRIAEDDYTVRCGALTVGRIMLKPLSGSRAMWLWSVTGPYLPPELQPGSGDAESLEEAKAALKARFDAWLHHAAVRGGEGHWHQGAAKLPVPPGGL